MSRKVWGPVTWKFLHTITAKLRPEYFKEQRTNIITLIKNVCETLPCPECRMHAMDNIKRARLDLITTKEDLVKFVFEFHNLVNRQTKKAEYSKDILETYNNLNLVDVVNEFASAYATSTHNIRLMTDVFHRNRFLEWLKHYLINNGQRFNG